MRKTAVVGILVGLALAMMGAAACPAVAKRANHAKAPPGFFGITPLFDPSAGESQAMSAAGVESVRLLVYWEAAEPSPGAYDWRYYDSVFSNLASAGLSPAAQFSASPHWISDNPNRPPIYSSAQIAAWQSFLTNFARRYGPGGTFWAEHPSLPYRPVRSWEIWNEANLNGYWGGPPNARDYLGLLLASRTAIRQVDPAARIIFSGLFPFPTPAEGISAVKFINKFYAAGGTRKTFDVLSLHPYSVSPADLIRTCRVFRKLLDRHRSRRIAMWVTELGWSTGGQIPNTFYRTTESKQAAYLTRSYKALIGARRRLRVQRVFWHTWQDIGASNNTFFNMGLLRADGSAKPSYYAYRRLARR
jgi:polysaccharide biosynthesis protein PslG